MQSLLPGSRCFLKKLFVYLFIFGCTESSLLCVGFLLWRVGATLCCDVWASHGHGFSCCKAQVLGARATVVVAYGLHYSMACGIFLDQGSNLCPLHWQVNSHLLTIREVLGPDACHQSQENTLEFPIFNYLLFLQATQTVMHI